ncbi:type II toxin-antitoxin system PemK/MazF family toxin [Haloferax namakaokahaiae]|uniref:Type II toxin-antitoxin system PemK/MazF family toxin n=1 Tax=Haloferax namakaokahaiae TaxID=1748331 RepID=A0ABD5ZEI4_9EURY
MTDEEKAPTYAPGDVVYGDDPFKGDEDARPWLVISNHEGQPFHGDQYISVTLTTKTWHEEFIEIPDTGWLRGGTPDESCIVPWGVQSLGSGDIDYWQGTLNDALVEDAIQSLIDYLK